MRDYTANFAARFLARTAASFAYCARMRLCTCAKKGPRPPRPPCPSFYAGTTHPPQFGSASRAPRLCPRLCPRLRLAPRACAPRLRLRLAPRACARACARRACACASCPNPAGPAPFRVRPPFPAAPASGAGLSYWTHGGASARKIFYSHQAAGCIAVCPLLSFKALCGAAPISKTE